MPENEEKTAANTSRPPEMTGYDSINKEQLVIILQERDKTINKLRRAVLLSDANYCELTGRAFQAYELRNKASKIIS